MSTKKENAVLNTEDENFKKEFQSRLCYANDFLVKFHNIESLIFIDSMLLERSAEYKNELKYQLIQHLSNTVKILVTKKAEKKSKCSIQEEKIEFKREDELQKLKKKVKKQRRALNDLKLALLEFNQRLNYVESKTTFPDLQPFANQKFEIKPTFDSSGDSISAPRHFIQTKDGLKEVFPKTCNFQENDLQFTAVRTKEDPTFIQAKKSVKIENLLSNIESRAIDSMAKMIQSKVEEHGLINPEIDIRFDENNQPKFWIEGFVKTEEDERTSEQKEAGE